VSALAEHVNHRAFLKDERHLRCVDCQRTLVLPGGPSTTGPTSTSDHPPADEQCPHHIGEWAGRCGRCRADQLEARTPRPTPQPTADIAARVAECRAQLKPNVPVAGRAEFAEADREQMAQARAELAGREPAPVPGEEAEACEKAADGAVAAPVPPSRYSGNPTASNAAQNGVQR
jgi:hypothetical protein